MPRECLKIIESKSKVRQSRNKAVVAKMSTSSSTPAISSDVAELKDMVRALILDRKNQTPASAPVKGANMYHDNIQEYVSQAAAANFNQANSGYRPPMVSNQIRPPGFPPVQNPHANNQNNLNEENILQSKRGKQFQTSVEMITCQTQGQNLQSQDGKFDLTCFQNLLLLNNSFLLPGLELLDTMPPARFNGSTEDIQPLLSNSECNPNPEPNVAPVVTPVPKASIPFPSRRNDERRKEKANDQIEKFYEIFRDLSFEISFTDALMLMPKFASTLKTLIGNKEKN
ncbi:hypothetical protein Tco_1194721 [Tanacetum coccineum]